MSKKTSPKLRALDSQIEFPKKIKFISDGNTAVLDEGSIDKRGKEQVATYTYTKSKTKKDSTVSLSLNHIEYLKNNFAIEIP